MVEIIAAICAISSFFTRLIAIRITFIIGVFIAGGWALKDLIMGVEISLVTTKQILTFTIYAGVIWEAITRIINYCDRKIV